MLPYLIYKENLEVVLRYAYLTRLYLLQKKVVMFLTFYDKLAGSLILIQYLIM